MDPLLEKFYQLNNLEYRDDSRLKRQLIYRMEEYKRNGFNGWLSNNDQKDRRIIRELYDVYTKNNKFVKGFTTMPRDLKIHTLKMLEPEEVEVICEQNLDACQNNELWKIMIKKKFGIDYDYTGKGINTGYLYDMYKKLRNAEKSRINIDESLNEAIDIFKELELTNKQPVLYVNFKYIGPYIMFKKRTRYISITPTSELYYNVKIVYDNDDNVTDFITDRVVIPIIMDNILENEYPSEILIEMNDKIVFNKKIDIIGEDIFVDGPFKKEEWKFPHECVRGGELKKKLGSGGSGVVYEWCMKDNCNYVVKIQEIPDSYDDMEKLRQEIAFTVLLNQKGIGPLLYNTWECNKFLFIVTEKWDGALRIDDRISKKMYDKLEQQIETINKMGLIHGDIFERNILVKRDSDNNVVDITLSDFGFMDTIENWKKMNDDTLEFSYSEYIHKSLNTSEYFTDYLGLSFDKFKENPQHMDQALLYYLKKHRVNYNK